MAYNYSSKVNVFNLTNKPLNLQYVESAYEKVFENPHYEGVKPYIEIYLMPVRKDLPISIAIHRTSRILDCSRYQSSFSSTTDGFNIHLNCHGFVTGEYLSWLACKCIKHIEILLNRENYNFLADKDELSKKRVVPHKETGVCNRQWKKDLRDSLSIEILSGQLAKDVTGKYFNHEWKKARLMESYNVDKINFQLYNTKEAQNLMKTLDLYEVKLVEAFKKTFFSKYYETFNYDNNEEWLRDKAWRLFKQHDFRKAIETINDLIKINQHNEEYYRLKGICYLHLREYKTANEALNTAIFNDPDNPESWYIKANCFYKLNNYSQTIASIDKALNIDNQNHHYLAVKALSLFSLKEYKKAYDYFTKSLKINPQQAKSWCLKGFCQLYTFQFEASLKSFDKALTIKPNYVDAILGKAFVLKRLCKYPEALEYFNKLQQVKPNDDYIFKCKRECILALNKGSKPAK